MSLSLSQSAVPLSVPDEVILLHDRVPGRVRLRAPGLKRRPELGAMVEREMRTIDGVREVSVNPLTGSVLIQFDPTRVALEQLLDWINRAQGVALAPKGSL